MGHLSYDTGGLPPAPETANPMQSNSMVLYRSEDVRVGSVAPLNGLSEELWIRGGA